MSGQETFKNATYLLHSQQQHAQLWHILAFEKFQGKHEEVAPDTHGTFGMPHFPKLRTSAHTHKTRPGPDTRHFATGTHRNSGTPKISALWLTCLSSKTRESQRCTDYAKLAHKQKAPFDIEMWASFGQWQIGCRMGPTCIDLASAGVSPARYTCFAELKRYTWTLIHGL